MTESQQPPEGGAHNNCPVQRGKHSSTHLQQCIYCFPHTRSRQLNGLYSSHHVSQIFIKKLTWAWTIFRRSRDTQPPALAAAASMFNWQQDKRQKKKTFIRKLLYSLTALKRTWTKDENPSCWIVQWGDGERHDAPTAAIRQCSEQQCRCEPFLPWRENVAVQ